MRLFRSRRLRRLADRRYRQHLLTMSLILMDQPIKAQTADDHYEKEESQRKVNLLRRIAVPHQGSRAGV